MPDETIQVKDRNGKVVPVFKKNLQEAIRRGGTPVGAEPPKQQEEGMLKQVGREIPLGAASGAGIPETMTPVKDLLANLKEQAAKMFIRPYTHPGAKSLKEMIEVNPAIAVPKGLVSTGLEAAKDTGVRNMNLGPGVDVPFAGGAPDFPKFAHDISSLLTQLGLLKGGKEAVETPLAESEALRGGKAVGKAAAEAPPKIVQSATGAKYAVNKAEKAANVAAQEKMSAYEKAKTEREAAVAEQKATKEARDTAIAEKQKATQIGKTKKLAKKYKEDLATKNQIEAENTKNEATKQVLSKQVESGTKQLTQNLKQTIDNAKRNFDAEYGDFDAKVLGKTAQNPKGTLQAELSPVAEAVQNAKKNLIEGTEESNKQFDSIMGRLSKDRVDKGGGELGPVPGEKIPAADLRGYITELERKVYDGNLLPDVRNAVRSVVESGKKELGSTIQKSFGEKALAHYKDLNSRYSDYLTDWRDTSSTNPLPKVRSKLLEGVAQNNPNYPVHLDIGRVLKGANAQKALVLLEKYRKYGADPKILADYNKALQQLDELPKTKKVPELKKPEYPERGKTVTEPFKPRGKDPEAPQIEPFNRQRLMRDTIEERMNMAGRIGQGFKLLKMVSDMIHANPGGALSEGEQMAVIEMVRRAMTSDRALNYFSREAQ